MFSPKITRVTLLEIGMEHVVRKAFFEYCDSLKAWMRNVIRASMSFILLMEEILHHQGCMKPWKKWDALSKNWCRISFHHHYHLGNPQADLSWKSKNDLWISTLWSYLMCNSLELPRDQVQYLFVPSLHTSNVLIKCDPVNLDDVSIYGSSCFRTGRCKRTSTLQNLRTLQNPQVFSVSQIPPGYFRPVFLFETPSARCNNPPLTASLLSLRQTERHPLPRTGIENRMIQT